MAIVQDAYDIPVDIITKLATGEYRRIGSVVRYAIGPHKGQIVKHLKPVDLQGADEAKSIGANVLKLIKGHKKEAIIIGAGAAIIGGGIWAYHEIKNREPKVVSVFRKEFRIYIDAIREGEMDLEKIDNLMKALEALRQHKDYQKISIQLTAEEIDVMVGRIYDYTVKLAADNNVELEEVEFRSEENNGAIINLQTYLNAQKRIFETAA